jgi:hypothetical protein
LIDRVEAWAIRSRLNPLGMRVLPRPRLRADDRRAFDALLDATAPGATVAYDVERPKWWFLHHALDRGFLLHGSNEGGIDEFRTRQTFDAHQTPIDAVFASDDAVWPLYFAVVNREALAGGYINWCEHVRDESRYFFSIGANPSDERSWRGGTVYLLPRETFAATPSSRELVSRVAVRPRARLDVEPDDFPFRAQTLAHRRGDTPNRVVMRHALRRIRPRSRARRRSPRRAP